MFNKHQHFISPLSSFKYFPKDHFFVDQLERRTCSYRTKLTGTSLDLLTTNNLEESSHTTLPPAGQLPQTEMSTKESVIDWSYQSTILNLQSSFNQSINESSEVNGTYSAMLGQCPLVNRDSRKRERRPQWNLGDNLWGEKNSTQLNPK